MSMYSKGQLSVKRLALQEIALPFIFDRKRHKDYFLVRHTFLFYAQGQDLFELGGREPWSNLLVQRGTRIDP